MDVHLKNKYLASKGQAYRLPLVLFSIYSHYLFGYKIKHVFIQHGIMAIIQI